MTFYFCISQPMLCFKPKFMINHSSGIEFGTLSVLPWHLSQGHTFQHQKPIVRHRCDHVNFGCASKIESPTLLKFSLMLNLYCLGKNAKCCLHNIMFAKLEVIKYILLVATQLWHAPGFSLPVLQDQLQLFDCHFDGHLCYKSLQFSPAVQKLASNALSAKHP